MNNNNERSSLQELREMVVAKGDTDNKKQEVKYLEKLVSNALEEGDKILKDWEAKGINFEQAAYIMIHLLGAVKEQINEKYPKINGDDWVMNIAHNATKITTDPFKKIL